MKFLEYFHSFSNKISKFMAFCSVAITCFLMLLIVSDAFARSFLSTTIVGTPTLSRNLLVATMFLGLPWVTLQDAHIRSDVILDRAKGSLKRNLLTISSLLGVLVFIGLGYALIEPTIDALKNGEFDAEGTALIPMFPFYATVLIGAILAALNSIHNFIYGLLNLSDRDKEKIESIL